MKKINIRVIAPIVAALLTFSTSSCVSDLDTEPISPKIDLESTPEGVFTKCYAVLAMA